MGWDRNCRALLKSARVKVSTEMFRDPKLLVEVPEWEKNASKNDPPDQLGKGVLSHARSCPASPFWRLRNALSTFLESKKVASLNLVDHRTGALREVEARTLTEYLARAIGRNAGCLINCFIMPL